MLRLQDVQLEREWDRIDRRVSALLSNKCTSESTTELLAVLEDDLAVGREVSQRMFGR
jgi:hypothetical protein